MDSRTAGSLCLVAKKEKRKENVLCVMHRPLGIGRNLVSLSHTRDANTPYNTTRHNTVQRNIEYKRLQSVPEQCLFQENTSSRHPAKYKTHFSQSALSPVQHPSVLPPTNDLDQRKHMAYGIPIHAISPNFTHFHPFSHIFCSFSPHVLFSRLISPHRGLGKRRTCNGSL